MKNKKYESGEARIRLARELAQEGMILLKNEDQVLPLAKGKTVALPVIQSVTILFRSRLNWNAQASFWSPD